MNFASYLFLDGYGTIFGKETLPCQYDKVIFRDSFHDLYLVISLLTEFDGNGVNLVSFNHPYIISFLGR